MILFVGNNLLSKISVFYKTLFSIPKRFSSNYNIIKDIIINSYQSTFVL